jgi:hypothetical protein
MEPRIVQLKGYVDPRSGSYVRTREDADPEQVAEALGFIQAWKFYWDGPLGIEMDSNVTTPMYTRQEWFASERRSQWVASLTEEQQRMLEDSFPPEEVPTPQ